MLNLKNWLVLPLQLRAIAKNNFDKEEYTMKKIEVYDPPMCCSTGVCGANVDEKLIEFAGALKTLSNAGIEVRRFNMAQEPQAFVKNAKVKQLLKEKGQNSLPFIFVDDKLKWFGKVPSVSELLKVFGVDKDPEKFKLFGGGCGGGRGCCG